MVKTNLDEIKNHTNIHLINHVTCGTTLPIQPSKSHVAEINEFPWVVRIQLMNGIQCGGTLITSEYYVNIKWVEIVILINSGICFINKSMFQKKDIEK